MDVPGYESRVEGSAMKTRTPAVNRRHLGRPFKSRSTTGALRHCHRGGARLGGAGHDPRREQRRRCVLWRAARGGRAQSANRQTLFHGCNPFTPPFPPCARGEGGGSAEQQDEGVRRESSRSGPGLGPVWARSGPGLGVTSSSSGRRACVPRACGQDRSSWRMQSAAPRSSARPSDSRPASPTSLGSPRASCCKSCASAASAS